MNKRRGKKGRRIKKEREKEETEEEKKKGGLASNPPFLRMRRPGPSARGKAQGIHPSARGKVLGPPSLTPNRKERSPLRESLINSHLYISPKLTNN